MKNIGKPDAGKLHVRFDEGGQGDTCSLLYRHPFRVLGGDDFQKDGLELQAMGLVVVSRSRAFDVFAGGNGCSAADYGDQFTVSPDLDAQDTEPGFLAVEGDPLHRTGEAFNGSA